MCLYEDRLKVGVGLWVNLGTKGVSSWIVSQWGFSLREWNLGPPTRFFNAVHYGAPPDGRGTEFLAQLTTKATTKFQFHLNNRTQKNTDSDLGTLFCTKINTRDW